MCDVHSYKILGTHYIIEVYPWKGDPPEPQVCVYDERDGNTLALVEPDRPLRWDPEAQATS